MFAFSTDQGGGKRRGGRHLFIFGVDIHNPYTFNDVSAYATGGQIFRPANVKRAEVITKRIRSPTALRKVFRPDVYFSVRQNLIYSSYRTRGRKYQPTPHIDRKKRQRSKDYEPQKRVTLVQRKPVPCFSKILSKGQCRASFAGAGGRSLRWRRQTRLDYPQLWAGPLTQRHERLNRNQSPKSRVR